MGFFIAYDKIYLAESNGRITSLLDIDEIDFPCTFINNEVNSYDELKQVLINENISRLFEYQRTMGHKPVLEIATTNKRSKFTISFYDQVIYEEFEDGTIELKGTIPSLMTETTMILREIKEAAIKDGLSEEDAIDFIRKSINLLLLLKNS